VLRKTSHNAFTTTNLQQILTARGVGELRVCGIRAEQCVDLELSRSVDDPACAVLRITWTSATDHLSGFRGSANFGEFLTESCGAA